VEPAAAPSAGDQPQRGWFRRNALWFVPTVILLPILLCAGSCGGIFYLVFSMLRDSQPYQMALARLRENPEVIQRLGEPVEDATWYPSGQIRMQGAQGFAQFEMKIAGPRGKADAYVEATADAGEWTIKRLRVVFSDGWRIELLADTPSPPEVEKTPPGRNRFP
jgi:Cytochrome oxidase complex assembly protein 1